MCVWGGEVLGFLIGRDWIKALGKISLESWGKGASWTLWTVYFVLDKTHTHKMVPEAVAQEKANGSLGGWIEALKKSCDKGNFLWNWRGRVEYVAALIMSWLEEENCLQGPSEWCFNCIQTAWGFLPEAFWSSVDSTVCKSEAVSVLSFVLMQIPEQDSKREQQLSHLIPWVELLFAPALGEDACCRLRLPLSFLLVKDQLSLLEAEDAVPGSVSLLPFLSRYSVHPDMWISNQFIANLVLCFTTFFFFPPAIHGTSD